MSAFTQTMDIEKHGQIASMSPPPQWIETTVANDNLQAVRKFHPQDDPSVGLYLYYRGHPLHERSASSLASLLAVDPHDLNDSEWWDIQEVVRDAALPYAFNMNFAHTTDWNGRRVLFVGGTWPKSNEESFSLYVTADASCSQIQEIIYLAPQSKYLTVWPVVERAMQSIRWIG
jgi:hypothetical protein